MKDPKVKAVEIVRNHFDVIAKAISYKGLKKEGEEKFYAIEKVAKECAKIAVENEYKSNRELLFNLRASTVIENEKVYLALIDASITEEKNLLNEIEKL